MTAEVDSTDRVKAELLGCANDWLREYWRTAAKGGDCSVSGFHRVEATPLAENASGRATDFEGCVGDRKVVCNMLNWAWKMPKQRWQMNFSAWSYGDKLTCKCTLGREGRSMSFQPNSPEEPVRWAQWEECRRKCRVHKSS